MNRTQKPSHGSPATGSALRYRPPRQAAPSRHWRNVQALLLAAGAVLMGLLVFRPEIGLLVMWNVLIPVAPALVVVAPGLWRNICPLATFSLLPRHLGMSRRHILPRKWAGMLGLAGVAALFLIVPLRHVSLNTDGPATAVMLLLSAGIALGMGMAFEWRSGWCASLCPIHPVEKLYGFAPAITVPNARCDSCRGCMKPCPDSTPAMTPLVTGPARLEKWLGHGLTGSFAGFIWGWYQLPDYSGRIGAMEVLESYLWPLACALLSLALYAAARHLLCRSQQARAMLVKVFATAAVSTYYWFRLPALAGFGPYHDTGLLYDLSGVLPAWAPLFFRLLTTSFFAWFLLLRRSPQTSWMHRPPKPDRQTAPQAGGPTSAELAAEENRRTA